MEAASELGSAGFLSGEEGREVLELYLDREGNMARSLLWVDGYPGSAASTSPGIPSSIACAESRCSDSFFGEG